MVALGARHPLLNWTFFHSFCVFLIIIITLGVTTLQLPSAWSPRPDVPSNDQTNKPPPGLSAIFDEHDYLSVEQYLKYVINPLIEVNEHRYTSSGGIDWELPDHDDANHTMTALGEQLCIIDLDNRSFNESGQIWADTPMSWDRPWEVHGLSLGVLNHWLYAKIHGYKYYYIHIDEYEDRRTSWKKAVVIPKLLAKHKICIYLDSDAIFHHLDLPFEWLLKYWQLDAETNSLALAYDPDLEYNKDRYDQTYLNTGFMIAQNNTRTFEIMNAWNVCPDEGGDHPDCTEFRLNEPGRPTDQGGFGTYIRYDYPDDIKGLPCSEGNGFVGSETECTGEFIQHLWTGKNEGMKMTVGAQMPGELLEMFHGAFLKEKEEFWKAERELSQRKR